MTTDDQDLQPDTATAEAPESETEGQGDGEQEKKKLAMTVEISTVGPCKKHVKVSIPREDIRRYFDNNFTELVNNAQVPGFRPGHAPRRLIEKRFQKQVGDQVKAELLMQSLEQLAEEYQLEPLSQPNLKPDDITLPADGSFDYEFDVEVRPDFDLPDYKGLKIRRPVREIADPDIDKGLERFLTRHGRLVPKDDERAEPGDYVTAAITFRDGDQVVNQLGEQTIRLEPELRFRDGHIHDFAHGMSGVRPDEERTLSAHIAPTAPSPALRGKTIDATFAVKSVKRLRLPELTPEFLSRLGYSSAEELRGGVRDWLQRRLEYEQRMSAREQVLAHITEAATWELPQDLVRRQVQSTLARRVMEMRRAGLTDQEIRARQADLQQNSIRATVQSLKEHFVLQKLADVENIDITPDDIELEITLMAAQSGETPRRVRARLEKDGLLESFATEILERKALDKILDYAEYEDVRAQAEEPAAEAVDAPATGQEEPAETPATEETKAAE